VAMEQRYGAGPDQIDGMNTSQLRENFMVEGLFTPGQISFAYTHFDRMIVGGAIPGQKALGFGDGKDVGTNLFFDAREMGVANLGGAGWIEVDGTRYELANRDVLYIGRGAETVSLGSDDVKSPARFYMNSVPAGHSVPTRLITRAESKILEMGDTEKSNRRSLAMYIHPEVAPSCLLLMGITDPAKGSVWKRIAISIFRMKTGLCTLWGVWTIPAIWLWQMAMSSCRRPGPFIWVRARGRMVLCGA